jgi:hypothetical protein
MGYAAVVLLGLFALSACQITEGEEFRTGTTDEQNELYGYKTCETSADCGVGRFCDDKAGICAAECASSRDCYFKDEAAMAAWEDAKEKGIPFEDANLPDPSYKCSECGTCIPIEDETDSRCVVVKESECETDVDCAQEFGNNFACNQDGFCSLTCDEDQDCDPLGMGHQCADDNGRKVCQKWCWDDTTCAWHGFDWTCKLPDGVDQHDNYWSRESVIGRCIPRENGVDFGENLDENVSTYKLVGVYGVVMSLAFTNCGFALVNCQDSTNIHHMVFKLMQDASGKIMMEGKYCTHIMMNFMPADDDPTRDKSFDDIAWMEAPTRYTMSIPLHTWELTPTENLLLGDAMETDVYLEVRGALLENPATDPMPTSKDTTGEWDQDRDGKPGVTTFMNGVLSGEVYNVNRAFMKADFEIVQVAEDGTVLKMKGLMTSENESHVVGASKPAYIVDVEGDPYVDPARSYMRFVRMPDDTSCGDVRSLVGLENRKEIACGEVNERYIDPESDENWLCYTPTVDGPAKQE